ncbi:MAG TPA: lysylphosphatidylglycerol synthase transmembrane domain-containing protein [Dokdonella sp.]
MQPAPPPSEFDASLLRPGRVGVLLVIAALAATLLVPIYFGGEAALRATLHLSAFGYAALFALIFASWVARTLKLRLLLRRMGAEVGFVQMFEISLATDFGFLATPAGLGGYAASVYYTRRAGASMSAAAAMTAADQALDLVFFALALPVAGFAYFGSALPPRLVGAALTTAAALTALALGAWLIQRQASPGAWRQLESRWPRLWRSVDAFRAQAGAQTRLLIGGGPMFLGSAFVLTIIQWLTRYGILWLVLVLLGCPVSFWLLLALQALVLHVAQWSGVPAGGGGAELGLTASLAAWVPATTLATALLLWRMITLYLALAVGAIAIARLARRGGSITVADAPPQVAVQGLHRTDAAPLD